MVKTFTAFIAAVALAAAAISVPSKVEAATPVWVVPAIAAGLGGLFVGSAIVASNRAYAVERTGNIYVQPRAEATCRIVRERTAAGWRRVEICE
jgi:hypothetical protein